MSTMCSAQTTISIVYVITCTQQWQDHEPQASITNSYISVVTLQIVCSYICCNNFVKTLNYNYFCMLAMT